MLARRSPKKRYGIQVNSENTHTARVVRERFHRARCRYYLEWASEYVDFSHMFLYLNLLVQNRHVPESYIQQFLQTDLFCWTAIHSCTEILRDMCSGDRESVMFSVLPVMQFCHGEPAVVGFSMPVWRVQQPLRRGPPYKFAEHCFPSA